jgi:hypothetical protein
VGNPPAGIPIAAMPGVEIRFDPAQESELAPVALALGNALHADGTVVAANRNIHSNPDEAERDILLIGFVPKCPHNSGRCSTSRSAVILAITSSAW